MPLFNDPQEEYRHNPSALGSGKSTARYVLAKHGLPHRKLDILKFLKDVDVEEYLWFRDYISCIGTDGSEQIAEAYEWIIKERQ